MSHSHASSSSDLDIPRYIAPFPSHPRVQPSLLFPNSDRIPPFPRMEGRFGHLTIQSPLTSSRANLVDAHPGGRKHGLQESTSVLSGSIACHKILARFTNIVHHNVPLIWKRSVAHFALFRTVVLAVVGSGGVSRTCVGADCKRFQRITRAQMPAAPHQSCERKIFWSKRWTSLTNNIWAMWSADRNRIINTVGKHHMWHTGCWITWRVFLTSSRSFFPSRPMLSRDAPLRFASCAGSKKKTTSARTFSDAGAAVPTKRFVSVCFSAVTVSTRITHLIFVVGFECHIENTCLGRKIVSCSCFIFSQFCHAGPLASSWCKTLETHHLFEFQIVRCSGIERSHASLSIAATTQKDR